MTNYRNISLIGVGRLGLCFALTLEKAGYNIVGIDVNESYVKSLNDKTFTTSEKGVDDMLRTSKNFIASTNLNDALTHSNILFILVATPSLASGKYDHSQIEAVLSRLSSYGRQKNQKHLVISCTTMPGYTDTVHDKMNDLNYTVSYNPEFIAQGTILRDQQYPEMVLIGEGSVHAGDVLQNIHENMTLSSPNICRMSRKEAEICKISYNCFLTTKISFANMIGDIAIQSDVSPKKILSAIGCSSKVGNQYLGYGFGYGGPCFPRDNRSLAIYADDIGYNAIISKATDKTNEYHLGFQVADFVKKNDPADKVEVYSVTYKPGTDIIEESQQLKFAVEIAKRGYKVEIIESRSVIDKITKEYGNLFSYRIKEC